jgi:hypothetical protein
LAIVNFYIEARSGSTVHGQTFANRTKFSTLEVAACLPCMRTVQHSKTA